MSILNDRTSGVLLHVTSLPGPHGIGDFGPAARHFVDWLAAHGQRTWQWLPTTPIGPADSPYQSVSAFAGSPLMVALEPLVAAGWLDRIELPEGGFDAERADFARAAPWRMGELRRALEGFRACAVAADREAFSAWCGQQQQWLDDYALYMAVKMSEGQHAWWDWPEGVKRREPAAMNAARKTHADAIEFWRFVQWNFATQCNALKAYAHEHGVSLIGDLPIFVAHDSADCWARPDLYFLDENFQTTVVAGVPPDDLGPLGQRWGNPLYRWDRMAAENYAWWTARVAHALTQVDVIRIDHFRGFAGYWEIPASSPTAKEGQWLPGPGIALFDAIKTALGELPIIAEDLGLITPDVIELREATGFPGMKIVQFAFGGDGSHEFLPHNFSANVVAYTGTHDNDTAVGWWKNAPQRDRTFAAAYLGATDHDVHWPMMRATANSPARTVVFPMQDILGLGSEHRMNTPGTCDGNWQWRFTWHEVGEEPGKRLAAMTAVSGRGAIGLLRA